MKLSVNTTNALDVLAFQPIQNMDLARAWKPLGF